MIISIINILFRASKKNNLFALVLLLLVGHSSCKKLVDIPPPVSTITTGQVFGDSADANSALEGIYSALANNGNLNYGTGTFTVYCGSSADELLPFFSEGDQFSTNTLTPLNGTISYFWNNPYQYIYQANAIIENVPSSDGISTEAKNEFLGEAKFFRAFFYFYLVNLFGDVPVITATDYKTNALAFRTPQDQVYDLIIADLKEAQGLLKEDYSYSSNERIRANKWAATALLARVYLYQKEWANAEIQASTIISNSSTFSLSSNLNSVFSPTSMEAILQWQVNPSLNLGIYNATAEGFFLIPYDHTIYPSYYVRKELLDAFEETDQRKTSWLDSSTYNGVVYYYPFKYKIGPAQADPNAAPTEYYTVLRLAEQYLIRAEAFAQQNKLSEAATDIDALRLRAGLSNTTASTQSELLAAIAQERRIELFAEWGHRWFDLKRTGQTDAILGSIKPTWQSYQQLYPLPQPERVVNHNLTQNPGY